MSPLRTISSENDLCLLLIGPVYNVQMIKKKQSETIGRGFVLQNFD